MKTTLKTAIAAAAILSGVQGASADDQHLVQFEIQQYAVPLTNAERARPQAKLQSRKLRLNNSHSRTKSNKRRPERKRISRQ